MQDAGAVLRECWLQRMAGDPAQQNSEGEALQDASVQKLQKEHACCSHQ